MDLEVRLDDRFYSWDDSKEVARVAACVAFRGIRSIEVWSLAIGPVADPAHCNQKCLEYKIRFDLPGLGRIVRRMRFSQTSCYCFFAENEKPEKWIAVEYDGRDLTKAWSRQIEILKEEILGWLRRMEGEIVALAEEAWSRSDSVCAA